MVGPVRSIAFAVVTAVVLQLTAVSTVRAADVTVTGDVGGARVAQVIIRRALPWVLAIVEELLEMIPPGTPLPQPPPGAPTMDPDSTP